MHPSHHALTHPNKAAVIMASTGEVTTYRQLDERSNQTAHLFRSLGLRAGDSVAFFIENHPAYFELIWAAQRSGLRFTCISSKLNTSEAEYIVKDCLAMVFVTSQSLSDIALKIVSDMPDIALFIIDGAQAPFKSLEESRTKFPTIPIADQSAGGSMLYSSGTTGRPKGVQRAGIVDPAIDAPNALANLGRSLYGWNSDTVYLSPAPLYHAAPLGWSMAVHAVGGTVVIMDRFDPQQALGFIDTYKVTSAQWVPTHFVRMLKLPPNVRAQYNLSSLEAVFHAAAPCPTPVKEQMIDWWGPIVHEYYAGTEGNGFCTISAAEWLTHKGSVGRGLTAKVVICGEDGEPLPPRTEGQVFFAGGAAFEYHGDPVKTAESRNQHGWTTLGDVGWVDEDGFLYLTDRKSFMIISGGVNIYPQEIENLMITHPKVADVAVIGAPHEEMGEQVIAVVQPVDWHEVGPALAEELSQWTRAQLSHVKSPRRIDFMRELPRHPTGKLFKRLIRDSYWNARTDI